MIRKYFKKWWAFGLYWGFGMWLGTRILFPLLEDEALKPKELFFSFLFYIAFGLLFGWVVTPKEERLKSKRENMES